MNEQIKPPCKSQVNHGRMSDFAAEIVASPFAETDSIIGEVALVVHPLLYPKPLAETVMEEKAVTRVVGECFEARCESNYEEEMIDAVPGAGVGARSGVESEGVTFLDALGHANWDCCIQP